MLPFCIRVRYAARYRYRHIASSSHVAARHGGLYSEIRYKILLFVYLSALLSIFFTEINDEQMALIKDMTKDLVGRERYVIILVDEVNTVPKARYQGGEVSSTSKEIKRRFFFIRIRERVHHFSEHMRCFLITRAPNKRIVFIRKFGFSYSGLEIRHFGRLKESVTRQRRLNLFERDVLRSEVRRTCNVGKNKQIFVYRTVLDCYAFKLFLFVKLVFCEAFKNRNTSLYDRPTFLISCR